MATFTSPIPSPHPTSVAARAVGARSMPDRLLAYVRRRFVRTREALHLIGEIFAEMQEMRRASQRRYPFLDL